jgi:hypothetical protein
MLTAQQPPIALHAGRRLRSPRARRSVASPRAATPLASVFLPGSFSEQLAQQMADAQLMQAAQMAQQAAQSNAAGASLLLLLALPLIAVSTVAALKLTLADSVETALSKAVAKNLPAALRDSGILTAENVDEALRASNILTIENVPEALRASRILTTENVLQALQASTWGKHTPLLRVRNHPSVNQATRSQKTKRLSALHRRLLSRPPELQLSPPGTASGF